MLITATNKNSESAYGEGKRGGRHTCSCKEKLANRKMLDRVHLSMLVGQTKVLRGFVLSIQPFRLSIQHGFSLLPYVLMIELILTSLGLPLVGFYNATFLKLSFACLLFSCLSSAVSSLSGGSPLFAQ